MILHKGRLDKKGFFDRVKAGLVLIYCKYDQSVGKKH